MNRREIAADAGGANRAVLEPSATLLAEISRELAAWVPILRRLAASEGIRRGDCDHDFEITSATIRSIIAARKLRDDYFWPAMNENAWSVLLELFASRMEGSRLNLSDLCQATDLTSDTTLHWADWLAGRGLVALKHIEGDASPVDLTDFGRRHHAFLSAGLAQPFPLGSLGSRLHPVDSEQNRFIAADPGLFFARWTIGSRG